MPSNFPTATTEAPSPIDREELTDLISDAITDSIDMDWSASIGARYVVEALIKEGVVRIKEPEPPAFDIETATACPACGLEAKTLLHRFCQHKECPVRAALTERKAV